jgi:YebC/PmpR family DNA-binding regulatory protein
MGRAYEVRKAAMAETNAKKTKLYSKYGKLIANAAKSNPDISSNSSLKKIVDKAKKEQVPADVIKRAIDKGKNSSSSDYSEVIYEVLGPGGSKIIVLALTDNPNRSVADVRAALNKTKSKMASMGSLLHLYTKYGIVSLKTDDENEVLEKLLLCDFSIDKYEYFEGELTIYVEVEYLNQLLEALNEYETKDEIIYETDDLISLGDDDKITFNLLLKLLDEIDDVDDVYHNVDLS